MNKETLRMQMLAGVITEGQYKAKLEEIEAKEKESLNEHAIGGIVGIGAINQIPSRAKEVYEDAFEHFLGERYQVKPNRERDDIKDINEAEGDVMVDSMALASYIDELVSLADDMEYTPDMVEELQDLKAGLPGGEMSVENALNIIKQTIDITGDIEIDKVEALGQAVDYDDAIIAKAREIAGLDEGKEEYLNEADAIAIKKIDDKIQNDPEFLKKTKEAMAKAEKGDTTDLASLMAGFGKCLKLMS